MSTPKIQIQPSETEVIDLPSGNVVEVSKGMSRFKLARAGLLNTRFAPVYKVISGEATEEDIANVTPEDVMAFQAKLLCLVITAPTVVETPEEANPKKEIYWVGELPEEDIDFLTTDQVGGDPDEDSFPDGGGSDGDSDGGAVLGNDASSDDGVPKRKPKSRKSQSSSGDSAE